MEPLTGDQPTTATSGPLASALLDVIRDALAVHGPLEGLDPATYARGHAAFEACSDQRRRIIAFLSERLAARGTERDVRVLSVGCGDGSVDAAVADSLLSDRFRAVRYVGVEPFAGSAASFRSLMSELPMSELPMSELDEPRLETHVHVATFEQALAEGLADERFDVVTFVHSMYYVPDVATTVRAAHRLLRPGGELLVLSAPRGVLNHLAGALAPSIDGHHQWFSDDVARGMAEAGFDPTPLTTLDARVDLTEADRDVLDFTVQATLTDEVLPLVTAYLAEVALTPDTLVVPHPVDVYHVAGDRRR